MAQHEPYKMDYAGVDVTRRRRPSFLLWLLASVLFLAATCGPLLVYVWWLKLG